MYQIDSSELARRHKRLYKWQKRQIAGLVMAAFAGLVWSCVLMSPRLAEPLYWPALFMPAQFPQGSWQAKGAAGIPAQDCYFETTTGKRLHGWYFAGKPTGKTILFSHGRGGNITEYLDLVGLMMKSGASVFIYDYEGFGKSEGRPSLSGICRDVVAAYDYLHNDRRVPAGNIVAYGQSLGTGATCYLESKRPCAGIILQSGFSSLDQASYDIFPLLSFYPTCLSFSQHLNNLEILKHPHPPLLLLHGMKDQVIPVSHSEDMFKNSAAPKTFACLPHADHDSGWLDDSKLYLQSLQDFLSSLKTNDFATLNKSRQRFSATTLGDNLRQRS